VRHRTGLQRVVDVVVILRAAAAWEQADEHLAMSGAIGEQVNKHLTTSGTQT